MTSVEMQQTELMLCLGMTLFCRLPIIGSGISDIGENAVPARVKCSQPISGFGISSLCCYAPFFERGGVICLFVGLSPTLNRRPRAARNSASS